MEKLQPKLRFPEFEGEWRENRINDLYQLISGQHLNPDEYLIGISNGKPYFTGPSDFTNEAATITKWAKSEGKLAEQDDVLITVKGSGVGSMMYLTLPSITIGRQLMALRADSDSSSSLLFHYLQTKRNYFSSLASGNLIPGLSRQDILSTKISFPSLPEQTKIAEFLTAIDKHIELLTAKKEKLTLYKKGVMQKIFNQEIRFKKVDGGEFPEWEEKTLGEVCKLKGGYAFKSEMFRSQGIPVIRISNISNNHNYIDLNNLVYYDQIAAGDNFTIKKGDLILAMSGATTGKSSIYNLDRDSYLNQRVGLFKSKTDTLHYDFLIQYVFSMEFTKQLKGVLVAGAQPNVSSSDIESFVFQLPALDEQRKIASFLTAIDIEIRKIEQQITLNQTYKKALLQQMFV